MNEELLLYILLNVFATVLSLSLCLFSYFKLKNAPGAKHYSMVTLLSAIFTFAYALELASSSLKEIKFWISIEYYVMPFIPSFILLMCLDYVGIKIHRMLLSVLLFIPLITVFTHHTNGLHHLYYKSIFLREGTPFPIAQMEYGPFFYVHSLFLFLCLSLSVVILLMQLKKSLFRFKMQILTMVLGLLVPVFANTFYLNELSPYGIDLGPVSMSVSFILHGIALFSFQMFNVLPIARESVFENMLEGVVVINEHGAILDYNQSVLQVLPMLNSFSIGKEIQTILAEDEKLANLIQCGEDCDYEFINNNESTYYQVRFSPIVNKSGTPIGNIITFVNMTDRVEMQKKLKQLASFDGLTNIYNRTYFLEQSTNKLGLITQQNVASLILFDIDRFKNINDTYGHDAGDIVLTEVAKLAKSLIGPHDLIGRYGGEEFIIFLPSLEIGEAYQLAESIRRTISDCMIRVEDQIISVTSSFGVSNIQLTNDNQSEALKQAIRIADQALYAAKNIGRNNVQMIKIM
ncbi:diguanylate cyclase (GGDEF)-like protein [Ureibacillus xyleni]|uniref:Diguanylate cyclase (GGDEF)-like protein n=1 Tax=Ureibacillus xyleni TaxID=614648 RepID=A0A285SXE9_9BACL|nr:histidine kinase N-terminal 7TM domain-containing protein [Ureibacillus xyleni]SOC13302.1 diguanylate cyclase (GGDEF)-like protein [Ureibacillus xyleni]